MKRVQPEAVLLLSLVLKILSFRLGTLLLCGFGCFDSKWPFLRKFSEISLEKREEILKQWSGHRRLIPLRIVFVLIKLFCFYNFFSRVMFLFLFSTAIQLYISLFGIMHSGRFYPDMVLRIRIAKGQILQGFSCS